MSKDQVSSLYIDRDLIVKMRDANEPKEFLGRYGNNVSHQVRMDLRTLDGLLRAGEYEIGKRFGAEELDALVGAVRKMKADPDSLAAMPYALISELAFQVKTSSVREAENLSEKVEGMGPLEACALLHLARTARTNRRNKP